jgi:hypothetical protein
MSQTCRVLACLALAGLIPVLTAWAAPARPAKPTLEAALAQRVNFVGFEDPKTRFEEILDAFHKLWNVTFVVNEKAFEAEAVKEVLKQEIAQPTPIPPMATSLATVLRKVLARVPAESGATWMLRADHIEITTGQAQAAEVWGDYNGPRLPLVNAGIERIPLDVALRDLAEQAEFSVVIDRRAAEQARMDVTAHFRNTPLDSAVRLLSDMADLRPVQLDNVLYVTTRENAAAMEARLEKERKPGPTDDEQPAARYRKGSGRGQAVPPKQPGGM